MNQQVTTPSKQLTQNPFAINPVSTAKDTTARCEIYSNYIVLFWLLGTIFMGKLFAYIHVGPLYITEMVLGVLLVNNLTRLRFSDIFLLVVVVGYVVMGTLRHESFTFAGKDIIWMPYLLFLRLFPRNFPDKFIKIVVACCFIKVVAIAALPAVEIFPYQKYRDGVTILFCYLYLFLKKDGKLGIPLNLFFIVISALAEFKTLMLVMLIAPALMAVRTPWERLCTPANLLLGVLVLLAMIKLDFTRWALVSSVDLLNNIVALLKINFHFDTGTGYWRADIWSRAINNIYRDKEILFGQLPGFNYMDDKYLGRKLNLGGGQGLGVVRTGHNFLVQMMMKAGIVGVIIYGWYFFRNMRDRSRMMVFFIFSVLSLALTADVLEVPSRGPLFFSLFVILLILKNQVENKDSTPQVASF